jgi:hypothetical protein
MSNKASIPESLLNWQDKLTWSDRRKLRIDFMKEVEKRKKAIAGDKASTSPLGQRPSLDADHVPMPKEPLPNGTNSKKTSQMRRLRLSAQEHMAQSEHMGMLAKLDPPGFAGKRKA